MDDILEEPIMPTREERKTQRRMEAVGRKINDIAGVIIDTQIEIDCVPAITDVRLNEHQKSAIVKARDFLENALNCLDDAFADELEAITEGDI